MKKTEEEIKKVIEEMKAIRPKVRPTNIFGGDNLASFDIALNVFEERMDCDDVEEIYDTAGYSEEAYFFAREMVDWLDGECDDDFDPLENWPLIE